MIEKYDINILKPNWPKWKKAIANFFLFNLRFLHIRPVNRILKKWGHLEGGDFIIKASELIGFDYEMKNADNIPGNGASTLVCNHPGGADVLATINVLWSRRKDFKILANELICVKPVKDLVIPVNVMKKSNKVDENEIDSSYKKGELVVFYAAGKNSRYTDQGELKDRRWRTSFLDYAFKHRTPLNVCYIDTKNTSLFYKVSRFRENNSKFKNIPLENIFQLREIFKQKGRKVTLYAGRVIAFDEWSKYYKAGDIKRNRELADALYNHVYRLKNNDNSITWPNLQIT